jgi:diguanylate cyclase (GGDEF)-like protein
MGERKAPEFRATASEPPVKERRGQSDRREAPRRQGDEPPPIERRLGFDRRTLRERRGMWKRAPGFGPVTGWATQSLPATPPPDAELPFAARLREHARLEFAEAEAERHWHASARHRRNLAERLGRDVGEEVALLDYFQNISPRLTRPTIIERAALAAIERDALTDGLTGLFNQRCLESTLARELARCRRHRVVVSLVLLDVDAFKAVNERLGHRVGDAALQALGGLICRAQRAVDIPCRYDGDAFGVVLPDTDRRGAVLVAERISADARQYFAERPVAGSTLALTLSAGVVAYGPKCATLDAMLRAAQGALLVAQEARGGGVACAR